MLRIAVSSAAFASIAVFLCTLAETALPGSSTETWGDAWIRAIALAALMWVISTVFVKS